MTKRAHYFSPFLFFVTSPRTPFKARPEIALLVREFGGEVWNNNKELQKRFAKRLSEMAEYQGTTSAEHPDMSGRDRISRGPKAYGFVNLDKISLTPAGRNFLDDDLAEEALLRQLLKFQLPSPFHAPGKKLKKKFCVRPFLEMFRLIHKLGRLSFDELWVIGMKLVDWHDFDSIVEEVRRFRVGKERHKGQYKKFLAGYLRKVVSQLFKDEIALGDIHTRESKTKCSVDKFIQTKGNDMRDYADACMRHLRATGLVTVSSPGKTISIIESRRDEVEYFLKTVDRDPVYVNDEKSYRDYLYDADTPVLLTDNRTSLVKKAIKCAAVKTVSEAKTISTSKLKKKIQYERKVQRDAIISAYVTELKSYSRYNEVIKMFGEISAKRVIDPSLMFEWNVWRALTMMDGGNIHANLSFDDAGNPLSTAPGKMPDILCDYGDFLMSVEVTLMTGLKQYEAEGEPVARHLGDIKSRTGKTAYCLFVAPKINRNTYAYFLSLQKMHLECYGGKAVVIPLSLEKFIGMVDQSRRCGYIPSPERVRAFCEYCMAAAGTATNEDSWCSAISTKADDWLA